MTKLLTEESIYKLSDKLSNAQAYSAILGRYEFIIDDLYYHGGDIKGDFMTLQYKNTGISDHINIRFNSDISLDKPVADYPIDVDDLENIIKVTKIFTSWWNQIPEINE